MSNRKKIFLISKKFLMQSYFYIEASTKKEALEKLEKKDFDDDTSIIKTFKPKVEEVK